jgi:protein SCO1
MISISIDPEHDTPARLAEYAGSFKAGPQWRFYTGTIAATQAVQKAFSISSIDKMNHTPATFFRPARRNPKVAEKWVRLEGFTAPDDLLRELQRR